MRKNKLTLAVLAILAVVLVAMQSCKKEELNREKDLAMENNNDMDSYISIIDSKIPYFSIRVEDKVNKGEKGSSQICWCNFRNCRSVCLHICPCR